MDWRQLLPAQIKPLGSHFPFPGAPAPKPWPHSLGRSARAHPGNGSPKRGHRGLGRATASPGPLGSGVRISGAGQPGALTSHILQKPARVGGRRTAPPAPPSPRRALPLLPGVPLLLPGRTPSPRGKQLSLGADLGLRLWAPSAFSLPFPPLPPKGLAPPALPGQLPSPFPDYL